MKICICTTPIRSYPSDFPPFGSMAIIQSLRKIGEDVDFFNIDYFRYSHEEIEAYFKEHHFDVVGISAVVSTAYAYTKYLSKLIRSVSPGVKIIVGGNLAASAEILLQKCEVDFCVVGDGELIIRELISSLHSSLDYDRLRKIKGICFLDEHDDFSFTGYGERLSPEAIEFPDYSILEADGSLSYYISDEVDRRFYAYEGAIEPGKTVATVTTAKGCICRCTFCHRWEKGYRVLPVQGVIDHVRHLIKHYHVGFIQVADENFGANKRVAWEIASRFGEMGLKWQVAGVRTSTVNREMLQHWKDNGCVTVIYGIESGSQKILEIMEKRTTVEKNINALKWTGDVGLNTIIQLVIGLPGEDDKTIYETIEFLKEASPWIVQWENRVASDTISINYAQALPGTPLYEHARSMGLIGNSIDEEEGYLIRISDTNANSKDHFINCTGLPLLKVYSWRQLILASLDAHHLRKLSGTNIDYSLLWIMSYYIKILSFLMYGRIAIKKKNVEFAGDINDDYVSESGYFNIHSGLKLWPMLLNPITRSFFTSFLSIIMAVRAMKSPFQVKELFFYYVRRPLKGNSYSQDMPAESLRKTITIIPSAHVYHGEDKMFPLRQGR